MAAKMVDYAQKTLEMKQRMRKLDEALLHKKNPYNHLNALIVAALQLKDWLEKNDNHK
jgi:hypothetical protein